jgi:hypothetical protein
MCDGVLCQETIMCDIKPEALYFVCLLRSRMVPILRAQRIYCRQDFSLLNNENVLLMAVIVAWRNLWY